MSESVVPAGTPEAPPDRDRLHTAVREARDDAAPFALGAAAILVALAVVSMIAHWELLGHRLWWVWLLVAAPYCGLSAVLAVGLARRVRHDNDARTGFRVEFAIAAEARAFRSVGTAVMDAVARRRGSPP